MLSVHAKGFNMLGSGVGWVEVCWGLNRGVERTGCGGVGCGGGSVVGR